MKLLATSENLELIKAMRVIDGYVWCCMKGKIEVYNGDLELDRTITIENDSRRVTDIAEKDTRHVYVATKKALYIYTKAGL